MICVILMSIITNEFLRDASTFRKATIELNGGTEKATYAVTVGYTGSSGLEKSHVIVRI